MYRHQGKKDLYFKSVILIAALLGMGITLYFLFSSRAQLQTDNALLQARLKKTGEDLKNLSDIRRRETEYRRELGKWINSIHEKRQAADEERPIFWVLPLCEPNHVPIPVIQKVIPKIHVLKQGENGLGNQQNQIFKNFGKEKSVAE